jgi:hypothetical protein
MRAVRFSRTFRNELATLLAQGVPRFGPAVVAQKRAAVLNTIRKFLARHPVRPVDPVIGICAYAVTKTPFVILYDYDDRELRIHLVIHASADRTQIDLSTVEW